MKNKITFLVLILLAVAGRAIGQTPGTPDLTFGTSGKTLFSFDQTDLYNDVKVQSDGKIVAVGTSMSAIYSSVIVVSRFMPDGTLDASFGTGGNFSYTYNGNVESMAYKCLIKSNGKILIAGHTTDYTNWGILLLQLTTSGVPDASFGTAGVVYQSLGPGESISSGLVQQSDGKILISGYSSDAGFNNAPFIMRFTSSGAVDNTFGTNGYVELPVSEMDNEFASVCVQPDGKILAAGHYQAGLSWFSLLLARFNQNGTPDLTYGNAGVVKMNLGNVDDEFFDMQMDGNQCILTGFTVNQSDISYHLLLMKFDENGSPVTSFGDNGKVIWGDVPYTFGDAVEIQSDGKIIVAGCTGEQLPADNNWALWRFTVDGTPDNTFGTNGVTTTDFAGNPDEALGVELWQDKIVVAGKARNAANQLDFAVARYWNSFTALFTSGATTICNGSSVQFTDQSVGSPETWNWTFEGGTPSSSTLQNPQVSYSTSGVYDVTLEVTLGTRSSIITATDYIHVQAPVTAAPAMPAGESLICGSFSYTYTTTSVSDATEYIWSVNPAQAGSMSGNGVNGTFAASNSWNGDFSISVSGSNTCGAGPASPQLNGTLTHQPEVFPLISGGGYCTGQSGYEIKLVDSETAVEYQLYKDGTANGSPLPGTGSMLSFGLQPVGSYTVTAANGMCTASMQGTSVNFIIDPPAAAAAPAGAGETCNYLPSTFTATFPANAYQLQWTLNPADAGTIQQPTLLSALVTWAPEFSGVAEITVQGLNECGAGPSSPPHSISVNATPAPIVAGIASVCKNQEITYSVIGSSGSDYIWEVNGGNIVSGQGSNSIVVLWSNTGNATVQLTETSASGCTAVSAPLNIVINECTGIAEKPGIALKIYPNPVNEVMHIDGTSLQGEIITVQIFDLAGKRVRIVDPTEYPGNSLSAITVSSLEPGAYLLQITTSSNNYKAKFIKLENKL